MGSAESQGQGAKPGLNGPRGTRMRGDAQCLNLSQKSICHDAEQRGAGGVVREGFYRTATRQAGLMARRPKIHGREGRGKILTENERGPPTQQRSGQASGTLTGTPELTEGKRHGCRNVNVRSNPKTPGV